MLSIRAFQAKTLQALKTTTTLSARNFGAKKKGKGKREDGSISETETQPEVQAQSSTGDAPAWKVVTTVLNLDQSLFSPFTLGQINKVNSTPNNKAPSQEDTIEGRYAGVLFTTASSREALYDVYEDMMYLSELYTHSESFRQFTENAGVGHKEIKLLNKALLETAPFHETTMKFLEVLAENKRLIYIKQIAIKYQKLY